jgi:hypothetical protein
MLASWFADTRPYKSGSILDATAGFVVFEGAPTAEATLTPLQAEMEATYPGSTFTFKENGARRGGTLAITLCFGVVDMCLVDRHKSKLECFQECLVALQMERVMHRGCTSGTLSDDWSHGITFPYMIGCNRDRAVWPEFETAIWTFGTAMAKLGVPVHITKKKKTPGAMPGAA